MRNYFFADLKRVLCKPIHLIVVIVAFVMSYRVLMTTTDNPWTGLFGNYINTMAVLIGFLSIVTVFYQDYKNRIVQSVIGLGIRREQVVLTKFLEMILVTLVDFIIVAIIVKGIILSLGITFPLNYEFRFFLKLIFGWIQVIECAGITAIFLYASGNLFLITVVYLLLINSAISLGFTKIGNCFDVIQNYHFERFDPISANEFLYSNVILGKIDIFMTVLILAYILGGVGISTLLFSRKELEF